jgi:hypothetical protein
MIVEAAVDVYNFVNAPCYCTIWTDISGILTLFTVSLWLGGSRGLTGLHNHECTCTHLYCTVEQVPPEVPDYVIYYIRRGGSTKAQRSTYTMQD